MCCPIDGKCNKLHAGEMNGACGIGLWSGSTDVNTRGGLKSFNSKKGTPRLGRVPKTPAATSLGQHLADHLTGGFLQKSESKGRREGREGPEGPSWPASNPTSPRSLEPPGRV